MFFIDTEGNYLDVYADNKEHLLALPKEVLLKKSITQVFDADTSSQL